MYWRQFAPTGRRSHFASASRQLLHSGTPTALTHHRREYVVRRAWRIRRAPGVSGSRTPGMIEGSLAHRLCRPEVRGKYLFVHNQKLLVRGTTYGTFRPDARGNEYGHPSQVERDFAAIAAN